MLLKTIKREGDYMKRAVASVIFLITTLVFLTSCTSFPRYQRVTDGIDRKIYLVVGRVMDPFQRPVKNCAVSLTKVRSEASEPPFETIPVATTDIGGNYSFYFELSGATDFWLYFNASDQGLLSRYVYFTYLLESTMFQYTGNNPVIVNVVMLAEGTSQPHLWEGGVPPPHRDGDDLHKGPEV